MSISNLNAADGNGHDCQSNESTANVDQRVQCRRWRWWWGDGDYAYVCTCVCNPISSID